ncbi:MAG: hypothetical protein HY815_30245 [Candidatus Riflebacteria bacterium]|nr:hypothetical protein [Candidatus Riflebacteria bacterium]
MMHRSERGTSPARAGQGDGATSSGWYLYAITGARPGIDCNGPWPPFSFVNVSLKGAAIAAEESD